ncbi:secreted lipase [Apiospora arundinis]
MSVHQFAENAMARVLDLTPVNYLFLNDGMAKEAGPSSHKSQWCDTQVVNQLSHHYLMHLLRNKLVASKSRIVVASSGGIRRGDPARAETSLLAGSGADGFTVYVDSKLTQLMNAHWWRRQLAGSCTVVAVSPGLIPDTEIFRNYDQEKRPTMASTDAKTVEEGKSPMARVLSALHPLSSSALCTFELPRNSQYLITTEYLSAVWLTIRFLLRETGAKSLLRAFTCTDMPEDPDRIFLTSWGEWWETSEIQNSLDKELQNKWSSSKQDIRKD